MALVQHSEAIDRTPEPFRRRWKYFRLKAKALQVIRDGICPTRPDLWREADRMHALAQRECSRISTEALTVML